jgi:hypothetical protein
MYSSVFSSPKARRDSNNLETIHREHQLVHDGLRECQIDSAFQVAWETHMTWITIEVEEACRQLEENPLQAG